MILNHHAGQTMLIPTRFAAFVCLFSMFGLACEEPFPPATLVERLRILAVKAEPPELSLQETSRLSSLVIDPNGDGRTLQYTWAVCLFEFDDVASDIPCPGPESYLLPSFDTQAILDLPAIIEWLSAQDNLPIPDLESTQDLPDKIDLLIGLRVEAKDEFVRAIKRIKVRLKPDDWPTNSNPSLSEMLLNNQSITTDCPQLEAGGQVQLTPLVTDDSQELFIPEGQDEQSQEELLFSWYSTAGEFADQRTILNTDSKGNPLAPNEWTLPQDATDTTLWLVVRDGRYGIDWQTYQFCIE